MDKKIKIRKTVVKSRYELGAKAMLNVIEKSKLLKGKYKKGEAELFQAFFTERQSMRRAYAFKKWKNHVNEQLKLQNTELAK